MKLGSREGKSVRDIFGVKRNRMRTSGEAKAVAPLARLYTSKLDTFVKVSIAASTDIGPAEKFYAKAGTNLKGTVCGEESGHIKLEEVSIAEKLLKRGPWYIYKSHWEDSDERLAI